MTRSRILGACLIVLIPAVLSSCAPKLLPPGFVLLGSREVNFGVDRDTISIPPARPAIRELAVVARLNPVEVYNIRVDLDNGRTIDSPATARLFPGRDRILIDLPGEARRVRQVVFRYRKLSGAVRRAVVELWGR
jgi:hypothetical protein